MIRLEARDAKRNIHRRYEIEQSVDLFGWTIVETRWGRAGRELRSKVEAVPSAELADRLINRVLRKRARARKRIGVAYREVK